VDHEFAADDLPEHARFLAGDLLRAYASGVEMEEIWNEVTAHLDVLFPVTGRTAKGGRFFSRANLELLSPRRVSSTPKPPNPTPGHSAMKRGAVAKLRPQAASCAQQ